MLARSGFFNAQLRQAGFDGLGHAAHLLHFLYQLPRALGDIGSELLYHLATGPWINRLGDVGFILNVQLCVASNTRAEIGWQRNGFIERIGV